MAQLSTHLIFDGRCEEAFRYYEKCLGGKITFLSKWGEHPGAAENMPACWGEKVLHATLTVGERALAGADAPPPHYSKPQGFYVIFETSEPAEAERVFNALAEGGTVQMPMQETFWALRYGSAIDRFGIPWEINCGKPA